MKKTLTIAAALSVLSAPALAANMENPLYLPGAGQLYSKTGAGVWSRNGNTCLLYTSRCV